MEIGFLAFHVCLHFKVLTGIIAGALPQGIWPQLLRRHGCVVAEKPKQGYLYTYETALYVPRRKESEIKTFDFELNWP